MYARHWEAQTSTPPMLLAVFMIVSNWFIISLCSKKKLCQTLTSEEVECNKGSQKKARAENTRAQCGTCANGDVTPKYANSLRYQLGFSSLLISRVRPNSVREAAYNVVFEAVMQK
jgi:hypothetical protein